ncbi:MAG: hypothetical protein ACRCSN_19855, partial [Dermatophilaceae bacterium]
QNSTWCSVPGVGALIRHRRRRVTPTSHGLHRARCTLPSRRARVNPTREDAAPNGDVTARRRG